MVRSFWIHTSLIFLLSLQLSAENSQEKSASGTVASPLPSSIPAPLASDNFQILEFKAPSEAAPGAKIACTVKMKVIAGNPQFPRPSGHIIWNDGKDSKPIPGEAFVPWQFLNQKAGQELSFTVNLQIPENVEIGGKIKLQFTMFGVNDGKYIYGTIFKLDGELSTSYAHIITVKKTEALSLQDNAPSTAIPAKYKLVTVPAMPAPQIDGDISETEWKKAALLGNFVNNNDGKSPAIPTRGFIGHDDGNIYIAFVCDEPAMDKITAVAFPGRHDAPIWKNDGIELFFRQNTDSPDYVQFIADTLNQHYDSLSGDFQGFNPVWKSAVKKGASGWTMEVAIPVSAIGGKSSVQAGAEWQADFFRNHKQGDLQTAWQPTEGQCASINRFGILVFDSLKEALNRRASFAETAKVNDGKNSSPELDKLTARIELIKNDISKSDKDELEKKYFIWRDELGTLEKKHGNLLFTAQHANSNSPLIVQDSDAFGSVIKKTNSPMMTELKGSFLADETRQFAFTVSNISDKPVSFRCTFRYGVTPGTDGSGFNHLRLGLPGFTTIWRTPTAVASADGSNVYDALPENPSGTYRVAIGETIQCFVSVTPGTNAKAQTKGYLVIHDIDGGNLEPMAMPVDLRVIPLKLADFPDKFFAFGWDFLWTDIAKERPEFAKAHFAALRENGFNIGQITGTFHLPRPKADKDGNLIGKMDFNILDEFISETQGLHDYYFFNVAIWEKQGLRADLFGLDFYSPEYAKAFKTWLGAIIRHLEEKGVSKTKLVFNPYDESLDKRAQIIAGWIKEADPSLTVLVDCSSPDLEEVKRMDKFTDIWMPHTNTLTEDALQKFHSYLRTTGKPVMAYYYSTGGNEKCKPPYGDYVLKFWSCFDFGLRGLGFWAAGQYYGDPYYRKMNKKAYDTALVYPDENGVTLSRRLLAWKRGIQDYYMLKMTEAKLKSKGDTAAIEKFRKNVKLVIEYPNELKYAEDMRQYCRELLAGKP